MHTLSPAYRDALQPDRPLIDCVGSYNFLNRGLRSLFAANCPVPPSSTMSNPNALFLLADHVKLSLLERQRAKTLNLESDSQDGHISRSLDQLRDGLESLAKEQKRLEEAGDNT